MWGFFFCVFFLGEGLLNSAQTIMHSPSVHWHDFSLFEYLSSLSLYYGTILVGLLCEEVLRQCQKLCQVVSVLCKSCGVSWWWHFPLECNSEYWHKLYQGILAGKTKGDVANHVIIVFWEKIVSYKATLSSQKSSSKVIKTSDAHSWCRRHIVGLRGKRVLAPCKNSGVTAFCYPVNDNVVLYYDV